MNELKPNKKLLLCAVRWHGQVEKAKNWIACNTPGIKLMNEAFDAVSFKIKKATALK